MSVQDAINDLAANPSAYNVNQLRALAETQSTVLTGTNGAVLYSGNINGTYSGSIADNIATQNGLAIIDNTDAAILLDSEAFREALLNATGETESALTDPNSQYNKILFGDVDANGNRIPNGVWDTISDSFVTDNASGDVRIIGPLASESGVLHQTEIPALLNNPNVTHINGILKAEFQTALANGGTDGLYHAVKQSSIGHFSTLTNLETGTSLSGAQMPANDNIKLVVAA